MNFYFAFDEYTDLANADEAMQIARDVMYAFKHTDRPFDNKLNEMSRQYVTFSISLHLKQTDVGSSKILQEDN